MEEDHQVQLQKMKQHLDYLEESLLLWRWKQISSATTTRNRIMNNNRDHQGYLYRLLEKLNLIMDDGDFILNTTHPSLKQQAMNLREQLLLGCEVLVSEITAADPLFQCMERMKKIVVAVVSEEEEDSSSSSSSSAAVDQMETGSEVCAICQEELRRNGMGVKLTECGHKFHGRCLFKWLQSANFCPNCRFRLLL